MKVIISSDSVKFPLTGIGRYTYELIKAFQQTDYIDDLKFLNGYKIVENLNDSYDSRGESSKTARTIKNSAISYLKKTSLTDLYRLLSPFLKSRALASYEDYIFHGTNFYVPKFKGRSISTFHDLSPFSMPECIEPKRRDFLQKQLLETINNSSFFITDTFHTRSELINYFNIPEDKVKAVHLACDESFRVRPESEVRDVLKKYDLNYNNFTLCVCTIEPRKNLDALVDAYSLLPDTIKSKYPLVLVGHEGWCSESTHKKIIHFQNKGWLKYLSFVHRDELPLIYSSARMFVFPSLYEGFGLPVLEAMSSGVPVICSNASCLPEVAGNAALFFEPNDVTGLKDLIQVTIENSEVLATYRQSGIQRASEFSWHRCAYETLDVYNIVNRL